MIRHLKSALVILALTAAPAAAETELSLYFGWQGVSDSTASGTMPGGVPFSRTINWSGKPFSPPPYWGGRAIWWTSHDIGFGIEGTHAKAYSSAVDMAALGLGRLEFTNGQNIVTANVMKRWPDAFGSAGFTPYIGGGIGVAVPHVEVRVLGAANRTFGYQMGGVALRGIAGVKYALSQHWALFSEFQLTWSDNDVTIDPDPTVPGQLPGRLKTRLLTQAVNFGVSYSF